MRKLGVAALISNMLILVGAGHGVAPILLLETSVLFRLPNIAEFFSSLPEYEKPAYLSSIILLIGQILFVAALFTTKRLFKVLAMCILWIGFVILTYKIFSGDNLAGFSLLFGLPFLILSGIYTTKLMVPVS